MKMPVGLTPSGKSMAPDEQVLNMGGLRHVKQAVSAVPDGTVGFKSWQGERLRLEHRPSPQALKFFVVGPRWISWP